MGFVYLARKGLLTEMDMNRPPSRALKPLAEPLAERPKPAERPISANLMAAFGAH